MLIIWFLGLNTFGFIEEDSWSPSISQPSTWRSWKQPIRGSREVWTQADKRGVACLLLAEPILCPILLKKRKTTAGPSSPTWQEQSTHHFQITQVPTAHFSFSFTGNNEFWYCSRSRFLHNSSKITGSNQSAWEMKKHDGETITMSIPVPKGTQGVAPTAQTREEATLLMLTWLEECGLVEGSQFRDLSTHELLSLSLLGGTMMGLWILSHKRHA